jgi:hypothetical protein
MTEVDMTARPKFCPLGDVQNPLGASIEEEDSTGMIVLDGGWQFLPGMQLDKIGLILHRQAKKSSPGCCPRSDE